MSTLLQEFTNIISALNEREIDYAVCGGWAMAILGFPRATIDIDLLILSENLSEVWKIAESIPLNSSLTIAAIATFAFLIGGLMFALVLTLFVIPAVYSYLSREKKKQVQDA